MEEFAKIIDAMLEDMPIRQLAMMSGGGSGTGGNDERPLPPGSEEDEGMIRQRLLFSS